MKRSALTLLLVLCLPINAAAQTLTRESTPEPLRPWIEWTLHGHEKERCPFFQGREDQRQCTWPSRLHLELKEDSGRFSQDWLSFTQEWVSLPGDAATWPLDVRLDGKPAAVAARGGAPAMLLPKGRHTVSGVFIWDAPPPLLAVPPGTGLLRLTLRGRVMPSPARDEQGRVWLEQRPGAVLEESRLEIAVQRHLLDEVPLILTTRLELAISGESREELLGRALPEGFVPLSLSGMLPARLEPDGRLRVQARPGRFTLTLVARHEGPAAAVVRPASGGTWDDEEVWVFAAQPDLRLVTVEGVPAIDPQQTTLPEEWKLLPAYLVKEGERLTLTEKRRGDSDPAPDQLALQRTWWLDFDGRGGTVHDSIAGSLSRSWRLEMQPPAVLGRVAIGGEDQFITRLGGRGAAGVEVRQGTLDLDSESRYTGSMSSLPAVGWDADFREVSGALHLGPGWRLFHASGVDDASPTWISSWTLLDIFLVLILVLSAARLWGPAAGALALVTLALSWIEPGAPRWSWIAVVTGAAMVRVFPKGKFQTALRVFQGIALLCLVVVAVPFVVLQVRSALYPALEAPFAQIQAYAGRGLAKARPPSPETPAPADAEAAPAREMAAVSGEVKRSLSYVSGVITQAEYPGGISPTYKADLANLLQHDPGTVVQTGPGLPSWEWRKVSLRWRGPVERAQRLRLFLVPPSVNSLLALLRAGMVLVFGLLFVGSLKGKWGISGGAAAAKVLLIVLLLVFSSSPSRAEFPPGELLESLRARLTAKPECHPECASAPRLILEARGSVLRLRLEIVSAAETAVPLPGGPGGWPERVLLDGAPAPGLRRDSGGLLWISVGPGSHQVAMEGILPDRDTVEIPLPLRPHHVSARTEGWRVLGIQAGGRPEETLQLVRERATQRSARSFEARALPPFVRVERELTLGLRWQARTRVIRVSPAGSAIVLEVPLLQGESVTTADVRVKDSTAFVSLAPNSVEVGWESSLAEAPVISLQAPEGVSWTEVWRLGVGTTWHAEVEGIPVVHVPGESPARLREWRPWPGEKVAVRLARPAGIPGRTLTIDRCDLSLAPGLRATDATLRMSLRSSRGGQHAITLPEGSVLQSVSINESLQPIRLEGRTLTLPIAPGAQQVSIVWREPRGIGLRFRAPGVDLGAESVNTDVSIAMPSSRWTLFVGGTRLGPAVIFWGFLVVSLVVSLLLGRSRLTPLRGRHWFLLSLGLTQAPLPIALLVVGWLFALGARGNFGGDVRAELFDLAQVALAGLTLTALAGLFWSIQRGLLGLPEMQISGYGSTAEVLRWYQDRSTSMLPRPWVLSVPLLFYRLAMLVWSLWLSVALLSWLRWGWRCFSEGGLWKRPRPSKPAPPPLPTGAPSR